MEKQKGLGLIGFLFILSALILTAGGVVVWERRIELTPSPTPPLVAPSPILEPPSTASNEKYYCQNDTDCDFNRCQSCDVQNRSFISDKDRSCLNYCSGVPKCVNNQCRLGFEDDTPQIVCEAEGGKWQEFPNSCVDNCLPLDPANRMTCLETPTFGCGCGKDQCWNGAGCVSLLF